ncbi:hypothetical protein [uncultured Gammaproteobacteria bacterium]|nr:hypothetical protein [uncultured Gammaproteobacteria bacterium]
MPQCQLSIVFLSHLCGGESLDEGESKKLIFSKPPVWW